MALYVFKWKSVASVFFWCGVKKPKLGNMWSFGWKKNLVVAELCKTFEIAIIVLDDMEESLHLVYRILC